MHSDSPNGLKRRAGALGSGGACAAACVGPRGLSRRPRAVRRAWKCARRETCRLGLLLPALYAFPRGAEVELRADGVDSFLNWNRGELTIADTGGTGEHRGLKSSVPTPCSLCLRWLTTRPPKLKVGRVHRRVQNGIDLGAAFGIIVAGKRQTRSGRVVSAGAASSSYPSGPIPFPQRLY